MPNKQLVMLAKTAPLFLLMSFHTSGQATSNCPSETTAPSDASRWNIACAKKVVVESGPVPVSVVERTSRGVWQQTCTLPAQKLATGSTWASCPPPPACTPEEEAVKRRHGEERLALWKQRCEGKKVTIPEDDPHCSVPVRTVHSIVVHQTEAPEAYGPDKVQRAHMNRGYDDIGYHYVIAKTETGWRIFRGRSEAVEGAHAGAGLNEGSISIAVAGDYRAQSHPGKDAATLAPPPQAVVLLKSLVLDIRARHATATGIYGHGEYKRKGSGCDTDCPSVGIQQLVNALRAAYF